MSYHSRLQKAFEGALRLPLNHDSKYVLFSDCHRGVGNSNDNFLKNQPLYTAALQHYFQTGFTYIELGDGDELWENRDFTAIIDAHSEVFRLLSRFYNRNRLYMLWGNHDIVKQKAAYTSQCLGTYPCCCCSNPSLENKLLFPNMKYYEGIILEHNVRNLFLTHGHQADLLGSTLWPLSRFLVRYVWKPLERYGMKDPTSAAINYSRKQKTEERLHAFAAQKDIILSAGHTHRPLLSETDPYYVNCGSCVHPYSITCLELEHMYIRLVKWKMTADTDMRLYVTKEDMREPVAL